MLGVLIKFNIEPQIGMPKTLRVKDADFHYQYTDVYRERFQQDKTQTRRALSKMHYVN